MNNVHLSNAAAVPTIYHFQRKKYRPTCIKAVDDPTVYENGTIADSLELPKLAARDGCNSGNIFNVNHAVSLANDLQNNSPDQMTEANHRSWHSWTWGEARICIYNNYVFENTHVKRWEVGWVTKYIYNQCCNPGGNQNCAGGDATCHGDSGLSVHAVLQNSAYGCNQL
ncbi:hypothetical protein B0H66DRAFT_539363 [Apodospora peruviana]|uniref:Uncharacterized protein n=1 Tax=Apodospora peruviana TaxID=516989 RepID=A0AAE0IP62_9PEZI|nr:hypothetical protein B0H66DRAFT_539363 [Apodospora peruviana]